MAIKNGAWNVLFSVVIAILFEIGLRLSPITRLLPRVLARHQPISNRNAYIMIMAIVFLSVLASCGSNENDGYDGNKGLPLEDDGQIYDSTYGMGWSSDVLCTPPVIIGGIIYVPLISAFAHGAPFVSAWLFEDRIHGFDCCAFPYGPYFPIWDDIGALTVKEEIASVPYLSIEVNGEVIDSPPPIWYTDSWGNRYIIVPVRPIAQALGYHLGSMSVSGEGIRCITQKGKKGLCCGMPGILIMSCMYG